MRSQLKIREYGFTLVEMMLVMVIISTMIWMGVGYMETRTRSIQIDRASAQIQQILNAGLSYYVNAGAWPTSLSDLQTGGYLPSTGIASPWGTSYTVAPSSTNEILTVSVSLPVDYASGSAIAQILAGKLPFGVSTDAVAATSGAAVSASVNIPGENLNNIGNVNYAGLYHNGACVPAPTCPASSGGTTFYPQIIVAPVSVSGMSDTGKTDVYPLVSLTAKAIGDSTTGDPVDLAASTLAACGNDSSLTSTSCYQDQDAGGTQSNEITSGIYWRVCLYATTAMGDVTWDVTTGKYATVMAITRCAASSEPTGSSFDVWAH